MKSITRTLVAVLTILALVAGPALAAEKVSPKNIDLVICLDTSGSMNGLIDSAKAKLWDIVNDLAQVKPTPNLRVALYSYGNDGYDRNAGWVKKDLDLTSDLDELYQKLFALRTNGGTEYATRVSRDAIEQLKWSEDAGALKIIFVCGNEPAGQDKVVSIAAAGKLAQDKGIIINTIYCGPENHRDAADWKVFADASKGRFASINQNKGTVAVSTPVDKKLAELGAELNKTYVVYGGAKGEGKQQNQILQDRNAEQAGAGVAAARANAKSTGLYNCASWDIVDLVKQDPKLLCQMLVKDEKPIFTEEQLKNMKPEERLTNIVKNIPEDQLCESLKKLKTVDERVKYVKDMTEKRVQLQKEIQELNTQRNAFVAEHMKKNASEADKAFGRAVRDTIRDQANSKGFEVPTEKKPEEQK